MGIVYHGSKEHGIKRLKPRKSTHGDNDIWERLLL